jgi:hypothetical protein
MGRGNAPGSGETGRTRLTQTVVLKYDMRIANRQSWSKLQPLPEQQTALAFQRSFNEDEYARLAAGLIPEKMEDKWFIFLEEGRLYFHRSWTGLCIFVVSLEREGTSYTVTEARVNRDPAQYGSTGTSYDEALLAYLVNALLLEGKSVLPLPADLPAGIASELHLLHVVGTGPPEDRPPVRITLRSVMEWLWHWVIGLARR